MRSRIRQRYASTAACSAVSCMPLLGADRLLDENMRNDRHQVVFKNGCVCRALHRRILGRISDSFVNLQHDRLVVEVISYEDNLCGSASNSLADNVQGLGLPLEIERSRPHTV